MIKQKHYESHRRDGDFYFFQMILADSITLGVCLPGIRDNVHYGSFFVEKCTRYKGQEMFQKAPGFSGGVAQRRTKKNSTSVRIELTILRLTVARLNQLGHGVIKYGCPKKTMLTHYYNMNTLLKSCLLLSQKWLYKKTT